MFDLNKYIKISFCKKVEKHLHEIGIAKPYYLSYRLPETYEYKGKKYKITDCSGSKEVWKPTLLGKIFGSFLFFCYPFIFMFNDFFNKHYTFIEVMGKYWFYIVLTAIFNWGFFWNVPSNDEGEED